jgi:hypothetical protein
VLFSQRFTILVAPVVLGRMPDWPPGPLPVDADGTVATAAVRATYFNERAANALYGSARRHQWADEERVFAEGFDVRAAEVVAVGAGRTGTSGLLAVHLAPHDDGLALVVALDRLARIDRDSPTRAALDALLAGCGGVRAGLRRATTITLAETGSEPLPLVLPMPAFGDWPADLQWLWLLASATPTAAYQPPPDDHAALLSRTVRMSQSWSALVTRDGTAMIGCGTDMQPAYTLYRDAANHFRTIYLDALLLAQMQRLRLTGIADDLASLNDPTSNPDQVLALEHDLAAFRNVLWWQHLGPQWHANDLLRAYQDQHELHAILDQISHDLNDFARTAQTAASERTEALVGVVAVVGLPIGGALELLHVLGVEDPWWVAFALAIAAAVIAAILSTTAGRTLVRLWLHVGRNPR